MLDAIKLSNLKFTWPGNNGFTLGIDNWQVSQGQKVFLYGPSGSGKSTLLNLISAVNKADSGTIEILGEDLSALSSSQRDRFRANNIGMIFQQFNLLPYLSAKQNIELGQYFGANKKVGTPDKIKEKSATIIDELADRLSITQEMLQQKASRLSVGQQQRVAVARALVNQPRLIIADEPTSALDPALRDAFIELLLSNTQSATVIFVSHDQSLAKSFDQQFDIQSLQENCTNSKAKEGVIDAA